MSYVIYHKGTTRLFYIRGRHLGVGCTKDHWASAGAAKAALTRAIGKGHLTEEEAAEYEVCEAGFFAEAIEKTVKKSYIHPHTGERVEIEIPINTPACCDPSTETYWSM